MTKTLTALALAITVVQGAARAPQGIERVAWLQGCWQLATADQIIEEQWMSPRGGSMLGMSRTVRDGKLAAYETMLIRERGPALAFEARPSGQPEATFVSTSIAESAVVFENAAHDFPQQIGYRLEEGALLAWIAGSVKGKPRRVDVPYVRGACAER